MSDEQPSSGNIRLLETRRDAIEARKEALTREMPDILEACRQTATIQWTYFQALKEAGFSEAQALHLTAQRFANA